MGSRGFRGCLREEIHTGVRVTTEIHAVVLDSVECSRKASTGPAVEDSLWDSVVDPVDESVYDSVENLVQRSVWLVVYNSTNPPRI